MYEGRRVDLLSFKFLSVPWYWVTLLRTILSPTVYSSRARNRLINRYLARSSDTVFKPSIYLSIYLCICLSVHLSICHREAAKKVLLIIMARPLRPNPPSPLELHGGWNAGTSKKKVKTNYFSLMARPFTPPPSKWPGH